MAIIHRRVFFGKVGTGDQLIQHFKEGNGALQRYGFNFKSRILSDHMSGRSDRVAVEWEMDGLGDWDSAFEVVMANTEAQAYFNTWVEKLNGLIHYAEADNWHVR